MEKPNDLHLLPELGAGEGLFLCHILAHVHCGLSCSQRPLSVFGSPAESTGGSYSAPPDSPFPREMSVAHLHIQALARRPSSYPAEGIEYSDSDTGHFSAQY